MNNPLKYTDPSGYWWNPFKAIAKAWRSVWRGIKKYGRVIVAAVIAYYTGVVVNAWMIGPQCVAAGSSIAINASIVAGAAGGAAFGASSTLLHGGSVSDAIKSAATGAVSGAISGGISGSYSNTWNAQRIGVSAMGSGISTELQGGSFKDGFKAGMISSSLRYLYNKVVKFDVDGRHGERAASFKDDAGHALPNTNNFSFSHRASDYYGYKIGQLIPDFIKKNGGEGDFWSRFANKLPFGLNAVAGIHDNIFANGYIQFNHLTNVMTMIPVAAVTYGAMADRYGINAQLASRRH
jgi:hypothetical protein